METIVVWTTDFTVLATCPTVATDFTLPTTYCHMSNNSKAMVFTCIATGCVAVGYDCCCDGSWLLDIDKDMPIHRLLHGSNGGLDH
jgi:hypothetical protein